jgi:protein-tyrosine phosphatase
MIEPLGWLGRRQRDGGIDRIPLPAGISGALWVCGKHAIGPDHERAIAETGGRATVVCLTEAHELDGRYADYLGWLRRHDGGRALWWPIHDLHAPTLDLMLPFVDDLVARLRRGDDLLIHCGAGIGRAGTTAVCVLLRLGVGRDDALATVGRHRPAAGPETGAQRDLVDRVDELRG